MAIVERLAGWLLNLLQLATPDSEPYREQGHRTPRRSRCYTFTLRTVTVTIYYVSTVRKQLINADSYVRCYGLQCLLRK